MDRINSENKLLTNRDWAGVSGSVRIVVGLVGVIRWKWSAVEFFVLCLYLYSKSIVVDTYEACYV